MLLNPRDNLRVNFLCKKNDFFYWPQIPDRDEVSPKIYCPSQSKSKMLREKVQDRRGGKIYQVFLGFSKKYF